MVDAENTGLRMAARSGGRLATASGTTEQLLSVATTVVLARVLSPRDFGLVAAANVIVSLFLVLTHFGLGPAIVRRAENDQRALSTLFWAVTIVAAVCTAILALGSGLFAQAVGEPRARWFITALSVLVLVRVLSSFARGLLQRSLRFRALYATEVVGAVVYATVQVSLAVAGAGAWSVVIGQLVSASLVLVVFAWHARWRPSRTFDRRSLREDVGFSGAVTVTVALSWIAKNADYWVVARWASTRMLGLYYIAYVLPNILRQRLTWAATDVLLPLMRRVVDDTERLRQAYLLSLRAHVFVGASAMAGIAILAAPIIHVFFGDGWQGAVLPMRILAVAAGFEFATQASQTLFLAVGRPSKTSVSLGARVLVVVGGLVVIAPGGVGLTSVAWVVFVATIVSAVISQILVAQLLRLNVLQIARAVATYAVAGAGMAAAVRAVDVGILGEVVDPLRLLVLVPLGMAAFVATGLILDRRGTSELLDEVRATVRRRSA